MSRLVIWVLTMTEGGREGGRKCVCVCVCVFVGCCLATKTFNLNNRSGMGGGVNGCDSGLLGVTSNKWVTFPRRNSIHPSGSCCSIWGMVHVCMYVCIYVCMYEWMYVCMYLTIYGMIPCTCSEKLLPCHKTSPLGIGSRHKTKNPHINLICIMTANSCKLYTLH